MSEVEFIDSCKRCGEEFEPEFNEDFCEDCQNVCQTCGKTGGFNTNEWWFGVRCRKHKEDGMVNAWRNKDVLWKIFCKRLAKLGARPKKGETYRGNKIPINCVCKNGHECAPTPHNVQKGQGICKKCAGLCKETAEIECWVRLQEIGCTPTKDAVYQGNHVPIPCVCKNGHLCNPRPIHILNGQGPCKKCAGNDPEQCQEKFVKKLAEKGGKLHETAVYVNNRTKIACVCKNGHLCYPTPSNVLGGQGICEKCMMCPSCGLFRTRGGLCEYCKPRENNKRYEKTKELKTLRFLRENFPDTEFIHNKSCGYECTDTKTHRYPDIRVDRPEFSVIIEIDEFQHRGPNYICDEKRMREIVGNLGVSCYFIRYNPDSQEGLETLPALVSRLATMLEISAEKVRFDDYGLCVEYMFYDL
jgi:hypothetical protein